MVLFYCYGMYPKLLKMDFALQTYVFFSNKITKMRSKE